MPTARAWIGEDETRPTDLRLLGADDGIRTRDPHLGKVVLYQLSHVRVVCTMVGAAGGAFNRARPRHERPDDPNPPSPRCESGSSSTNAGATCGNATTTSCAMRSPASIVTA